MRIGVVAVGFVTKTAITAKERTRRNDTAMDIEI